VLDLGLPKLDGLSVLRRWRKGGRTFPVLILSARSDWTEKVEGIESGADDYLAKPFQAGELVARTRALVRRAAGHASALLEIGALALDTRRLTATLDGKPVRLSPLEYRLLDYLAHHQERAVSAGELAEHLYGETESGDTNAVEALIVRLRRKLGAQMIETRRLLSASALAIALALGVAVVVMGWMFAHHLEHNLARELTRDGQQLIAALHLADDGRIVLDAPLSDARFELPGSGRYWQLTGRAHQERSLSLWDETLPAATETTAASGWHTRNLAARSPSACCWSNA